MHAVPGREDPDGPDASGVAARGAALVDAR